MQKIKDTSFYSFEKLQKEELKFIVGGFESDDGGASSTCYDRTATCYVDTSNYTQCNDERTFTYTDGKLVRIANHIC